MNPLTDFIQTYLYPALFERANMAFPELGLKQYKGGWATPCKLDGTQSYPYRQDKSVITRSHPSRILEQGGESIDLLSYWMERNNQTSPFEAVCSICAAIGIQAPERQSSEEWEKYMAEIETRERHLSAMRKALQTTEQGAQVIEYLKQKRGYTEQYISKLIEWGIGVLTPEIASQMGDAIPRSLQMDKHLFAIPYRNRDRLLGFTFRDITGNLGGGDKYRFTYGLVKKANLFGLSGIRLTGNREKDRTLTIVEGQLDALHAQLEGLENVVATGGVSISTEALAEAKKMGVERVVLILDTEDTPEKNAQRNKDREKALRTIASAGLEGFIVTLPSEAGIKVDVDSYLNTHTIEELEAVIETNESAALFIYRMREQEALDKYNAQKQKEVWDERNISDFKRAVLAHIKDPVTRPTDRDLIYKAVSKFTSGSITATSIQEEAEAIIAEENAKRQTDETRKALAEATSLLSAGKKEEALEFLSKELPRLNQISREAEFAKLLNTPTEADFKEEMRKKKAGIPTPYTFGKGNKTEVLILPSGAITLICAPTSHGKSTLLQNLALHTAQSADEGAVLYFTFEEEASSVKLQMLNKYLNVEITRQYKANEESNNLRTLNEYYRQGDSQYFRADARQIFEQREPQFFALLSSGKLRIYRENFDAVALRDAINYLCKQIKVKAVFIDYIQLLRIKGNKDARRSELCDICDLFNNLAIDHSLPIVMAAQLNRKAASPLEIHAQNLAESADIERYANTIVALWNTSFKATTESEVNSKELDKLQADLNFSLGSGNKVYAKLIKNRGGAVGLEAVFDFNGNTGVITQQTDPLQTSTPIQQGIF